MAIPFNIPNGGQPSQQQQQPTAQSPPTGNPANSETQQANQPDLPQFDSFDSEVLIQAFYEAICRCAQGMCTICWWTWLWLWFFRDKNVSTAAARDLIVGKNCVPTESCLLLLLFF